MALFSLKDIDLGFGGPLILDQVNLQVEDGERVGLLGRNGEGKSTLLKLMNGDLTPASGQIARQQAIKSAYLTQEVPEEIGGTVAEVVAQGLQESLSKSEENWQKQLQVAQIISRMDLKEGVQFNSLSAGLKRRVLLARSLVNDPDVLLLDEPTNHLDIAAIQWLENFLIRWNGTLVFVTHDRAFLQNVSSRIIELDRGRLFDWNCDYLRFLERKQALLSAEQTQFSLFDRKLAQEEQWIRQGIEARRTRNEGRVRALQKLRALRAERREQPRTIQMQIQDERKSGHLVIEVENLSYSIENRPIIANFSTTVRRGDKIGIIGPNGSGKTTLLRLLLGELKPQTGSVELGTNLEIAYFDQLRRQLNEDQSVLENVGQGRDVITVNGRDRNIYGYLEEFLFSKERVNAPIRTLSGGERNRLMLAKILAQPANLLVMDEPTNDLDIDTLEILEDLLLDFNGTLLLVSHDRAFLNNIATSTIVLNGSGKIEEYVGGYDDWQRQVQNQDTEKRTSTVGQPAKTALLKDKTQAAPTTERITYKDRRLREANQKELAELPQYIESLEIEQHALSMEMAESSFYQKGPEEINKANTRLILIEKQLEMAYLRWAELEKLLN